MAHEPAGAFATCPKCGVLRVDEPACPACGAAFTAAAPAPIVSTLAPSKWAGEVDDAAIELKIRTFAIPAALLGAKLLLSVGFLAAVARIFFSMWVHEAGHAITAWLAGYWAVPGPWRTMIGDSRAWGARLLALALIVLLGWQGWKRARRSWLVFAVILGVFHLVATYRLTEYEARALFTFGGDAGCLVLGTLLMSTMYAGRGTKLHRDWLRWGFLVFGAVAFVDASNTWWAARGDFAEIPFGENEGVGPSDASRLVDEFRWSATELVGRYVALSTACLVALGAIYGFGLCSARSATKKPLTLSRMPVRQGARPPPNRSS